MRVGVIGSGKIGGTLAGLLAGAGHEVALASRRVGTIDEAARGDVVVVAIPVGAYGELPAASLAGRVVVDAGNY